MPVLQTLSPRGEKLALEMFSWFLFLQATRVTVTKYRSEDRQGALEQKLRALYSADQ